jgi:uncharacterized membrane protein
MQTESATLPDGAPRRRRIDVLDMARGCALLAMAVYHFTWDLEFFGYVPPGMTAMGGWKLFARCIASSFLVMVGFGLVLAHRDGIRWRPFGKRLAQIVAAAAAITAITYVAVPNGFIFFGILHQIALASLLGLLFLRVPVVVLLALAALVVAAPWYARSTAFDHPALWWVGLSTMNPRSNDYVPLFPWFGAVLAGMAAARLAQYRGWLDRLSRVRLEIPFRPLAAAGRHSLAFYLLHQPALIAIVWLASLVIAPPQRSPEADFGSSCRANCQHVRDAAFCNRYCVCMLDELKASNDLDRLIGGEESEAFRARVGETAGLCTALSEGAEPEE